MAYATTTGVPLRKTADSRMHLGRVESSLEMSKSVFVWPVIDGSSCSLSASRFVIQLRITPRRLRIIALKSTFYLETRTLHSGIKCTSNRRTCTFPNCIRTNVAKAVENLPRHTDTCNDQS